MYHLYVVKTAYRDELKSFLDELGIQTAIHYPTALPLLPAYRHLGISTEMIPVAAQNQQRILSIPIFPEMTGEMIDYVVQAIRRFFEQNRSAT